MGILALAGFCNKNKVQVTVIPIDAGEIRIRMVGVGKSMSISPEGLKKIEVQYFIEDIQSGPRNATNTIIEQMHQKLLTL